ncbi:aggregation factor core [Primorskyibacter sp. S187A]|uniref:aggregation factor core n=1 Tax=Primorskyibacter sp. S187A TaxID=3415130 RepID=UPI003C7A7907
MLRLAFILSLGLAQSAAANISVHFIEGAPKDRFQIVNLSTCDTGAINVTIDLSTASGALIFDTTGSGAGVEVFQPFELVSGADQVRQANAVSDGDTRVELSLTNLKPESAIAFTVDVDDTLPASANGQIMVSDSEMDGATFAVSRGSDTTTTTFKGSGRALLPYNFCQS